jgi:hypothetical protein
MKKGITVKGIIGSAVVIVGIHLASGYLLNMIQIDTYIKWAVYAVGVAVCAGIAGVLVNSLLYRQQATALLRKLRKR